MVQLRLSPSILTLRDSMAPNSPPHLSATYGTHEIFNDIYLVCVFLFLHMYCRIHKLVLDHFGIRSVSVVIGGSMGRMAVLEWPLCTPADYVSGVIPLATFARHSA